MSAAVLLVTLACAFGLGALCGEPIGAARYRRRLRRSIEVMAARRAELAQPVVIDPVALAELQRALEG